MALTLEQVRHVARLARLKLSPDEEQLYQKQLSAILDAVAELQSLDTSAVEPTSHASFTGSLLRPDEERPSLGTEKALQNAPARSGSSFAVPKIIE